MRIPAFFATLMGQKSLGSGDLQVHPFRKYSGMPVNRDYCIVTIRVFPGQAMLEDHDLSPTTLRLFLL
jgi:hypothetical protein